MTTHFNRLKKDYQTGFQNSKKLIGFVIGCSLRIGEHNKKHLTLLLETIQGRKLIKFPFIYYDDNPTVSGPGGLDGLITYLDAVKKQKEEVKITAIEIEQDYLAIKVNFDGVEYEVW